MKYLLISTDDAAFLAEALARRGIDPPDAASRSAALLERLKSDTGGDFEDIAAKLKALESCPACAIEGQERTCVRLEANALGRRLRRLIERAQG